MAVVGIGTVFVALAIIVAIISLIARMLGAAEAPAMPPVELVVGVDTQAARGDDSDRRRRIAIAAYGFHLARRVAVRSNVPASPWLRAGRQAQVNRIGSRG